jgi:Protein of unknown function (DUF2934)
MSAVTPRRTVIKARAVPARAEAQERSPQPDGTAGPSQRHAMIAEAAYFLAESRGFEAGHDLHDWLAAECEIDRRLSSGVH